MSGDPEGVVEFKADGTKYRLFFGMRAQKAVEQHYDKPFIRAVQSVMPSVKPEDVGDKAKMAEAGADLRFTDLAKLFEFGLLKYQPEIEEDEVDDLIDILGLGMATECLGQAVSAAFGSEAGDDADANPPAASRKKKTGSRSLAVG